jgi:hypothetical protein
LLSGQGTRGRRRLVALAEEAAAFAAKIQRLCIENKISMENIDVDPEDPRPQIGDEEFAPWQLGPTF